MAGIGDASAELFRSRKTDTHYSEHQISATTPQGTPHSILTCNPSIKLAPHQIHILLIKHLLNHTHPATMASTGKPFTLAPTTRLVIATQGSTKIYRPLSPSSTALTRQDIHAHVAAHAALWFAPDPCQPFAQSRYAQRQIFSLDVRGGANLGLIDWVSEGRGARGEKWEMETWRGRNEVWDDFEPTAAPVVVVGGEKKKKKQRRRRLVLRDNVLLQGPDIRTRVDGLGVFGTLILIGPLLCSLATFFVDEFKALPRIGARDWSGRDSQQASTAAAASTEEAAEEAEEETEAERRERWRKRRQEREKKDGVLWTAASVRGAVVVKFGAREVEGAKIWLGDMLREEGTVGREFGPGGLICVK
ncbi:MAG: hypothetical protein LQ341_004314 [Variospora aurantia]|nr:MAG: hypothetical protein LQ341_004314 [Variospora aurantia]